VTAAKIDTVTKQQAQLLATSLSRQVWLRAALGTDAAGRGLPEALQSFTRFQGSLQDFADARNVTVGALTPKEVQAWATELTGTLGMVGKQARGVALTARKYAYAVGQLDRNGLSYEAGARLLDEQIRAADRSPIWDQLDVAREVMTDQGYAQPTTIEAKIKELRMLSQFIAAEIALPADQAQKLAADGYKAVAGRQFLFPSDLTGLDGPFAEITKASLLRASLGLFLTRTGNDNPALTIQRNRNTKLALEAAIERVKRIDAPRATWDGPDYNWTAWSADTGDLVSILNDYLRTLRDKAATVTESKVVGIRTYAARVHAMGIPQSIHDLNEADIAMALNGDPALRRPSQAAFYGPNAIKAIKDGLLKGKPLAWENQGLYVIQDHLVANSMSRYLLNTFAYSEAATAADQLSSTRRSLERLAGVGASMNASTLPELQQWRQYQRVGMAVLGAGLGSNLGPQVGLTGTQGAIAGAITGAVAPQAINPRSIARFEIGTAAAKAVQNQGGNTPESVLAGIAAGTVGMAAARTALTHAAQAETLFGRPWRNYSMLNADLVRVRDLMRFSLNPIFDIRRNTENYIRAITRTDVTLPSTLRPMRRAIKDTGLSKHEIMSAYRAAQSGKSEWIDGLETTQKYFYETGIAGFTPLDWFAGTHAQLVKQGMDPVKAAEKVRDIYTYGVQGRSGLEQSINFVFFPFSFLKKYSTQIVSYLSQDVGRTMMLHDGMKSFEMLNSRFDLTKRWHEQLPILDQLKDFNALAWGVSLGQLGGISRPLYDIMRNTPGLSQVNASVLNLFLPQGLHISGNRSARDLRTAIGRAAPILRDARNLLSNTVEQADVATSPTHRVNAAVTQQGWEAYRQLRLELKTLARGLGVSEQTVISGRGGYGVARDWWNTQIAKLEQQYPAWRDSRIRAGQNAIEKNMEVGVILRNPDTPAKQAMVKFDELFRYAQSTLSGTLGANFRGNADLMPEGIYTALRREAIQLASTTDGFGALYRRFYQSLLGPIEGEVS